MNYQNDEMEIDILGLAYYVRKKLGVIAAVTLISMVLGFAVSSLLMTPKYTASTRMYVVNRSADRYASSDFVIASYMLNDYQVLITGQNVTNEVIADLNLELEPAQIAANIEVSSPENTRVLQIDYTDTDPARAAQIANALREEAIEQLQSIMEVDAVKVVYEAEVPANPSSPNVLRNTLLATVVGFALSGAWYILCYLRDDSIRTEEDVARYLGLGTLGVIPVSNQLATGPIRDKVRKQQLAPRGKGLRRGKK